MVIACFGWEYYLWWRISLLRWWCFLCTAHWRFFACHSCQTYLGYLFLKDCVWLCWDPLQPLWVNHISHTQTQMQLTEAWKRGADRQRKQQLLLGGSSHTGIWRVRTEGGGRSALIYQSHKSRPVNTDIHHSYRWTDSGALRLFMVVSVNERRILGSFITIFSLVIPEERWNAWHDVFVSSSPQFFQCSW